MDNTKKRKKIILILFAIAVIVIFIVCDLVIISRRHKAVAPANEKAAASTSVVDKYKSAEEITSEKNNPSDESISYYNEGLRQFDQKKYNLALTNFSKAIEINSKKEEYYNKKSQTELNLGMDQAASDTIKLGLVNNPNSDLLKSRLDILQTNLSNSQDGVK